MAILSLRGRDPRRVASALLLALMALCVGCALLRTLRAPEPPLSFSHRLHVGDEGLECAACHVGVEQTDEPGMPALGQCLLCHEEIDAPKPPEKQVASLFTDGKYKAARATSLADETLFSHRVHANGADECGACHRDIEANERIGSESRVTMQDCRSCHAERRIVNECSTCHSEIGLDWQPPSHHHNWKVLHGKVVRADTGQLSDTCSLCHQESSCTSCHQDEPPANHGAHWRLRGHGVAASMDRASCAACHRSDSCDSCHEETQPLSHSGSWGSPIETHCLGCHFPLKGEGCFTCHKQAPSHALGSPKPADHAPGMNCLQCHGLTAPLPHVHKGDDCNLCHM